MFDQFQPRESATEKKKSVDRDMAIQLSVLMATMAMAPYRVTEYDDEATKTAKHAKATQAIVTSFNEMLEGFGYIVVKREI